METHLVYCPGRQSRVRLISAPIPLVARDALCPTDLDMVCMDAEDACSGFLCSLFGVPTSHMKERLRRFEDPGASDRSL